MPLVVRRVYWTLEPKFALFHTTPSGSARLGKHESSGLFDTQEEAQAECDRLNACERSVMEQYLEQLDQVLGAEQTDRLRERLRPSVSVPGRW